MARHRKKFTQCPNCGTVLKENDHFCPHCGQENHGLKIPFKHLFLELFESVFHFETKFFTTLKIIFTRPGQITVDFWEGRRARYMHPFRMYLFVSVLFFLAANKIADRAASDVGKSIEEAQGQDTRVAELKDLIGNGNRAHDDSLIRSRSLQDFAHLDIRLPIDPIARRQAVASKKTASDIALDSMLGNKGLGKTDVNRLQLKNALKLIPDSTDVPTQLDMGPIEISFRTLHERETLINNIQSFSTTQIDSLLDSMHLKNSSFNRTLLKQVAKINVGNEHSLQEITHVFMKNLSVVMFVLMPIVAFLLLFFFFGRNRYYFEHLIFSVHAHTILFLLCTAALSIDYFIPSFSVLRITFFINWIYFFLSLKTVYQHGWLKTGIKFLLLSLVYLVFVIGFLMAAFIWGFMTF